MSPDGREQSKASHPVSLSKLLLQGAGIALSALTIGLPLFGYGVALAGESVLAMPHSTLANSGFDYLELSIIGVSHLAAGLVRAPENWRQLFDNSPLTQYGLILCTVFVGLLSAKALSKLKRARKVPTVALRDRVRNYLNPPDQPLGFWRGTLRLAIASIALSVVGVVAPVVFALVTWFTSVFIVLALTTVPAIGLGAGKEYIRDYVLAPKECVPLGPRLTRVPNQPSRKPSMATCVVVCKDGAPVGQGRVVFATSSAVVLYEPNDETVLRVPTDGNTVKVVGRLDGDAVAQCPGHALRSAMTIAKASP